MMTVKAINKKGAVALKVINVSVTDKNTKSVYIKYGSVGKNAPAPWNNFLGVRTANSVMANLKDENNAVTPLSVTMVTSWTSC